MVLRVFAHDQHGQPGLFGMDFLEKEWSVYDSGRQKWSYAGFQ